jgi:predicted histone-like DNA-binding protein
MATNQIQMRYNVVQANINEGDRPNNKWYARAVRNGTLSLRGLANHITEHGSIYTLDVVYGVLVKFASCLKELVAQGTAVKLDTLGTFYPSLESEGAVSAEDFSVDMIKGVHMRFLPTASATDNINSKELLKKVSFSREAIIDKTGKVVHYNGKPAEEP